MLNRRQLLLSAAPALWPVRVSGAAPGATVLYAERVTPVERIRPDTKELWVRAADLPRINGFEVKPQGACRADMCIPVSKDLKSGEWFNLTGFARRIRQAYVSDAGVWSFGEIPAVRGDFYNSRIAPDFAVPDRTGRLFRLSSLRGRKVLAISWASW